MQPISLEGARVRLVPLRTEYTDALWETLKAQGDATREVWCYFPVEIASRDAMASWIEEAQAEEDAKVSLPFAIYDRELHAFVGSTRLCDYTPAHRAVEIGATWLCPQVWRTPVNTECKLLLFRHAFETLNLIRVFFKTDARNQRSQRAIERLGAVREGTLRAHRILPDGFVRDSVYYSVLAGEWPNVEARLQTFLRG